MSSRSNLQWTRWQRQAVMCLAALLLAGCASPIRLPESLTSLFGKDPQQPAVYVTPGEKLDWGDKPGDARARTDPGYLIGPEDGLEIAVWRDETLKTTSLVRPDGGISFPLAGELQVAGRTVAQVRDELVKRLEPYLPDPVVSVSVVRVASYRVYVIGRVNKPGELTSGRTLDVLQALTIAGGVTPFAVEDEIRIIRRSGGKSFSIPFDYKRLRKTGDLSQNITLQSGDVVLVP